MRLMLILALLAAAAGLALLAGCPLENPDTAKKIEQQARVPGLDEAIIAKDRALEAAITMSWKSDPELVQEQLKVEGVHAGKVRITGIVSRQDLKDRAESIAKNQEGVVDVVSTITVDATLQDKRFQLDDSATGSGT